MKIHLQQALASVVAKLIFSIFVVAKINLQSQKLFAVATRPISTNEQS
jgi:hypothetical protein